MFEDIIGNKPRFVGRLLKNSEVVKDAIIDISKLITKGQGYITCDNLEVTEFDSFVITFGLDGEKQFATRIFLDLSRLPDGRIRFHTGHQDV